jgi:hypothetical protein
MNNGCSTTSTNDFVNASNIIDSLFGGILKVRPIDIKLEKTYKVCLKVTDKQGFSQTFDGLELTVKRLIDPCLNVLSISDDESLAKSFKRIYNDTDAPSILQQKM